MGEKESPVASSQCEKATGLFVAGVSVTVGKSSRRMHIPTVNACAQWGLFLGNQRVVYVAQYGYELIRLEITEKVLNFFAVR